MPSAQFSLRIELGNVQINRFAGNPALWAMPRFAGYPAVDLCDPHLRSAPAAGPPLGERRPARGMRRCLRNRKRAAKLPSAFRLPPSAFSPSLLHAQRLQEGLGLIRRARTLPGL